MSTNALKFTDSKSLKTFIFGKQFRTCLLVLIRIICLLFKQQKMIIFEILPTYENMLVLIFAFFRHTYVHMYVCLAFIGSAFCTKKMRILLISKFRRQRRHQHKYSV
jgi:hypothetical protein